MAWLNRDLGPELREKIRFYDLWKKGQETWKNYKDNVGLWGNKIRRVEAQPEFNLTTALKDIKKCFYKCITSKGRDKDNLHSLLDARVNSNKG